MPRNKPKPSAIEPPADPHADPAAYRAYVRGARHAEALKARDRVKNPPMPVIADEGREVADGDVGTPHLRQHKDIKQRSLPQAGKAGRQVRTRLRALHENGKIETRQWHAGERFERDHALGVLGVVDREQVRLTGVRTPGGATGITDAQADAMAAWRGACAVVGEHGVRLLNWLVVEDQSVDEIARRIGQHATAAQGALWFVLGELADHYEAVDKEAARQKRKVVA